MSKEIAIGMLRAGKNGSEMLQILDTFITDSDDNADSVSVEPTLEEIAF